ncbi:TetR/AcrR family transcriptional regulator [Nocardia sp. NPDC051832]|uniref:TetR/AcrR family transcriptional regulator n=1 Tax=Nocardia sp. NPDC051832 TaxID=3155673 RepID=UPI00341D969D
MTRADPRSGNAVEAAPESEFRRRLLDGMAEAVRDQGYRDTTVADVVRRARTSRRTFYEHFTDKQDCFIALLTERNNDTIRQIYAAVDPTAPWRVQTRQAVEAWIAASRRDTSITLAWIRDIPALGERAQQLTRDTSEAFVALIRNLTMTPEFQSADLHPPSRQMATILYGGYRELIASTVEEGGDITEIIDVAVETAIALIGPRRQSADDE